MFQTYYQYIILKTRSKIIKHTTGLNLDLDTSKFSKKLHAYKI